MRVEWTERAIQRVSESADYISAESSAETAMRWLDSVFSRAEKLAQFPLVGRVVPEIRRTEIRELIIGSYRVVYRIDEEIVYILTVHHSKMPLPSTKDDL